MNAAHGAVPELATYEDFIPLDPRFEVGARLGNRLLLVHPGHSDYPVSDVRSALFLADAVDSTLAREVGFGIRDLVELVLLQMNDCVVRMAQIWQPPPDDWRTARPKISPAEVAAYAKTPKLAETVRLTNNPSRAKRALDWATATPESFVVTLGIDAPAIGPWLTVKFEAGGADVPTGALTDALTSCIAALIPVAAEANGALEAEN